MRDSHLMPRLTASTETSTEYPAYGESGSIADLPRCRRRLSSPRSRPDACTRRSIRTAASLRQQQAELERLDNEVAALSAAQVQSTPVPAGSCDADVSRIATRRGGERFAASDFSHALSYYQDALAACPGSARAELNLARTYEAMGQRADAIAHYQAAAKGGGEGGDAGRQIGARCIVAIGSQLAANRSLPRAFPDFTRYIGLTLFGSATE